MQSDSRVRSPAVASLFYPGDALRLGQEVSSLLEKAGTFSGLLPKAMVVPHAGYVWSGGLAATACKLLIPMKNQIRRVVLLGPAHRVYLRGIALPSSTAFATPFGEVGLDTDLLQKLAAAFSCVKVMDAAHAMEHSLEVILPFLQKTLDSFTLVPLVVGETDAHKVASVLDDLWGGEETLILVSSDLSHFKDYASARTMDLKTAQAIEAMDLSGISPDAACGVYPLRGFLISALRRSLKVHRLGLYNSGDVSGDKAGEVVGYGAWAFTEEGI
ncbi:hypothetical protein LZ24_00900 [Desulfobotulus alkaliphilus]|uniref:MEMO1 family protein n=1 Tax=Desulfobotulus alkaliphilus TaxID=622671 RepID=A0A562RYT4_9BACT|nr:AmmeMemoRadiSam system protein B [Desulfobotulus alkaliphilus]TWI74297.1 hypothetical protein LZ24_00900 [Desulfobotulus alkaliphilus]